MRRRSRCSTARRPTIITLNISKSIVIDPDGSENAITFTALKTNTGLDAGFSHIEPKPGTQVIDYTKPPQPQAPPKEQPK